MKFLQFPLLLVLVVASTGCYHARVSTGLTPGATVIDKPWAHSFIGGLIPPSEVRAASECPNGVAIVETRQSFLNLLANGLTFALYSPMHIKVTCAAGGMSSSNTEMTVPIGASSEQVVESFDLAVLQAAQTGEPVVVRFVDRLVDR